MKRKDLNGPKNKQKKEINRVDERYNESGRKGVENKYLGSDKWRMDMENRGIDSLNPKSISDIECLELEDEDSSLFSAKKIKENPQAPRIGFNPKYQIKICQPEKSDSIPNPFRKEEVANPNIFQLNEHKTGYQDRKEVFTDEEIMEAFKILDIDHDEAISQEDIMFFLDYIKEPYKVEEVAEMVNMVTEDQRVSYNDFKKIGKGSLLPLSASRPPDRQWNRKAAIFDNLTATGLVSISPEEVMRLSEDGSISQSRFDHYRRAGNPRQWQDSNDGYQLLRNSVRLLSAEDLKKRRKQFEDVNIGVQGIYNFKEINEGSIRYPQIARILQISQNEAKQLYGSKPVSALGVLVEAIVHSRLKTLTKLEYLFRYITNRQTITFQEVLLALVCLGGIDQQKVYKTKLQSLYVKKGYEIKADVNKYQMLALIGQFSQILL